MGIRGPIFLSGAQSRGASAQYPFQSVTWLLVNSSSASTSFNITLVNQELQRLSRSSSLTVSLGKHEALPNSNINFINACFVPGPEFYTNLTETLDLIFSLTLVAYDGSNSYSFILLCPLNHVLPCLLTFFLKQHCRFRSYVVSCNNTSTDVQR